MQKETILKKAPKFKEEINAEKLSDIEQFVRRKYAEYVIWERKIHDYIVKYGLWSQLKITVELDIFDKIKEAEQNERHDSQTNNE